MKITRIIGTNVKGRSFDFALGSVNMIVGENASGKTARMTAIRLALLGHEPKLGLQAGSTFQLAGTGSPVMSVEAETEAGFISRSWTAQGGKVAGKSNLPEGFPSVPLVLLDSREFFALKTSDTRRRFIFNSFSIGSDYSPTSLVTEIKKITVEGHTDLHTKAIEDLSVVVMDNARRRQLEIDSGKEHPFQQWLAAMVESLKGHTQEARGTIDRMQKSLAAIAQIQSGEKPKSYRASELIADELLKARSSLSDLTKELGNLQALQSQETSRLNQMGSLTQKLLGLPEVPEDLVVQIAGVKAEIEPLKPNSESVKAVLQGINSQIALLESQKVEFERKQAKLLREYNDTIKEACCPMCKADGDAWRKSYKVWYEGQNLNLCDEVNRVRDKIHELMASKPQHEKQLKAEVETEIKLRELQAHLKQLESLSHLAEQRFAIKSQMELLKAEPKDFTLELLDLATRTQAVRETIAKLEREQSDTVASQQDELRVLQSQSELEQARAKYDVLKLASAAAIEFRDKMTDAVFAGLLTTANRFVGPLLKAPLEYVDGEIGMKLGKKWVTDKTFSGLEEALTYVAFSLALSPNSPFKLILLDEMGNLSHENQHKFVAHMAELAKLGVIDQFVGISTDATLYNVIPPMEPPLNVILTKDL